MKNKYVMVLLLLSISTLGVSQHYLKSAGLRLGHTSGVTYKQFVHKEQAFELMVSGRHNGLQFNAMYQWYSPTQFEFDGNFVLYYGIGAHTGFERLHPYNLEFNEEPFPEFDIRRRTYYTMGVDVIVGIEYRMLIAPLTISFDVKPYLNYIGFQSLDGRFWDSALSVKYVFNQ